MTSPMQSLHGFSQGKDWSQGFQICAISSEPQALALASCSSRSLRSSDISYRLDSFYNCSGEHLCTNSFSFPEWTSKVRCVSLLDCQYCWGFPDIRQRIRLWPLHLLEYREYHKKRSTHSVRAQNDQGAIRGFKEESSGRIDVWRGNELTDSLDFLCQC